MSVEALADDPDHLGDRGERELKDVACALCGGRERRVKFTDGPYSIVTCANCDLTYVTPRLSDRALVERVYDESYWTSAAARIRGYTDYRADAELYLRTYRKRLAVIAPHFASAGRVLDVGCAAGYFLRVMRERGWDVHGFEPSDAIRRTAIEALGAERVRGGLLRDAGFERESFDLVTLWDVLEHAPDPIEMLTTCASLLCKDGKLLVETQNVASLAARVLGRRWQHYKHAEHLHHFHRATLTKALEKSGLRPVAFTSRYGGKFVSPAFIAERSARISPLVAAILRPLARLGPNGVYVNLFDELVVVAERAN